MEIEEFAATIDGEQYTLFAIETPAGQIIMAGTPWCNKHEIYFRLQKLSGRNTEWL